MSIYVDIEKRLGDFRLCTKFEAENEILSLLGASGCGKSMTLKCIAGIEKPDKGIIRLDDRVLFDSERKINLPTQKRRVGMLFQNYALFPNMTVEQNIFAGSRREGDRDRRREATKEIMQRFGLTELARHYPSQISGGQQQRTALARILVSGPDILMLDEPFSALDTHLRFRLEQEVRETARAFGKTAILVSHDRDEVFRFSDKIAVMHEGKVICLGNREEIFRNPKNIQTATLTGCKNFSEIQRLGERRVYAKDWGVTLELKEDAGDAKFIGIRAHYLTEDGGENSIACRVIEEIENPFSYTIMLQNAEEPESLPISWMLEKEKWNEIRNEYVKVSLPKESLIILHM